MPASKAVQDLPEESYHWGTFLDTPPSEHLNENSRFVVVPVPYDGTTSFRSGARHGPRAIIEASRHLEDYDLELGIDASTQGIFTRPEVVPDLSGPKEVIEQVCREVSRVVRDGKVPVVLGGEHTVAIGAARACIERFSDLSVLYLDAHADLRDSYMGTEWGHASVARRISEICPIVEIGVRSISEEEHDFAIDRDLPILAWPPEPDRDQAFRRAISTLTADVYVSIDLDVLDPSLMPAVGTPEPGGMSWWDVTTLLREATRSSRIVGFDVTELSPAEGPGSCSSVAARLAYKLMGYIVAGRR